MKILFIGDIFGKPGRKIIRENLPDLISEFKVDVCIANGENVAGGKGITKRTANQLFKAGVNVFTSGNHLWDKRESIDFIAEEKRIIKPLNYPKKAIGAEYYVVDTINNSKLVILNLIGQVFMNPVDSPFHTLKKYLPRLKTISKNIIVDFHAEATAEKRALGYFADGDVSAIVGTHTHVQTADEEILPKGCAYITDVGMTGPHDSVIGTREEIILEKITTGMPKRFKIAKRGLQVNAVLITIDETLGKATEIVRIKRRYNAERT